MGDQRPDIVEMLEKEKEHYLVQITRVNIALAALRGEVDAPANGSKSQPQKRTVAWVKEISRLFDEDESLNTGQIKNKLADKGITEALDSKYHNTIYSTLSRMVNKKNPTIAKDEDGTFRKIPKKRQRLRRMLGDKSEGDTEEDIIF